MVENIENNVLWVLKTPSNYVMYSKYIDTKVLSKEGKMVYDVLGRLSDMYSIADVYPWSEVVPAGILTHPEWTEPELDILTRKVGELQAMGPPTHLDNVLVTWMERAYAAEVASLSDDFISVPGKFKGGYGHALGKLTDELHKKTNTFTCDEDDDFADSFERTMRKLRVHGTWRWRLSCLQRSIGSPYPGLFTVLAGRPDGGKTTLVISEAVFLTNQMESGGLCIIFNNESPGDVLRLRIMQSAVGRTRGECEADIEAAQSDYDSYMDGRRILVKDIHGEDIHYCEKVLEKYKSSVRLIIFDQAGKIGGFETKGGNAAGRLSAVAAKMRYFAVKYAPVIATIWADATAHDTKYIDMNQIHDSKTGVPGEADVLLGIGHSLATEDEGVRYINVPKNKSLACEDERDRHGKDVIKLDSTRVRCYDV